MSRYTLTINIQSDSKDLLDNLMVTLESINGDISGLHSVELLTVRGDSIERSYLDQTDSEERNLFLDRWVVSEWL
jgi:hypothetical protein